MKKCEAQIMEYKPFIMGGKVYSTKKCENEATCYSVGKTKAEKKGIPMYLCDNCLDKFLESNPDYSDTIKTDITTTL